MFFFKNITKVSYVSFFGDVLKFFRKRMDVNSFRSLCGFDTDEGNIKTQIPENGWLTSDSWVAIDMRVCRIWQQ